MENDTVDIFQDNTVKTEKVHKEDKPRGFKFTIGRCFDIFLITINITAILASLIAFISLAIVIATSANAAANIGLPAKDSCLLFAGKINDSLISFQPSSICYYILVSPPVVWCFAAFFIFFLVLKIWRIWSLNYFEIVIFIASLICLLYSSVASLILTIGHSLTCQMVAGLNVPHDTDGKLQGCHFGGAYYSDDGKFITFEGYFFLAEITLWITCGLLVAISLLHCLRLIIYYRRRSKRRALIVSGEV